MSPVMTAPPQIDSPAVETPRLAEYQSTGEILQTTRIQQGLSLDDIALQTFIKKNYLEALEEDRLEDLPAAVYACGYIRQYARLLDLDDAELVQHYQHQLDAWDGQERQNQAFRPVFAQMGKHAKMETLQYAEAPIEEMDTMQNVTPLSETETTPIIENTDSERQQLLAMRYQTEQFADQVFLHLEQEIEKTLSVVQNGRAYLQERLKTYSF